MVTMALDTGDQCDRKELTRTKRTDYIYCLGVPAPRQDPKQRGMTDPRQAPHQ